MSQQTERTGCDPGKKQCFTVGQCGSEEGMKQGQKKERVYYGRAIQALISWVAYCICGGYDPTKT